MKERTEGNGFPSHPSSLIPHGLRPSFILYEVTMPRKKRATLEESTERSVGEPSAGADLRSGLCGHINRHHYGPGECVCTLPKGHDGCHEGDYVDGDGEKRRGAWSDAAGEPVQTVPLGEG